MGKEQPTPRQLIKFVNSIGAILRQRNDRLPLVDVAFYCLLRRDQPDLISTIANADVINPRITYLLSPEIRQNLAGLYFGTSINLGSQLLLRSPIEKAIGSSDSNTLKQLSSEPGFKEVIESLDLAEIALSGAVEVTQMASTFDDAGILTSPLLRDWVTNCLIPIAEPPKTTWAL